MDAKTRFDFDPAVLPAVAYAAGLTTVAVKHAEICDQLSDMLNLLLMASVNTDADGVEAADLSGVSRVTLERTFKMVVKLQSSMTEKILAIGIERHKSQFDMVDKLFPELADVPDYRLVKDYDEDALTLDLRIELQE